MIIEVKDLVKRYKDHVVLDHLELEINEGEIFGLLGPNGSGKTTLINCLLGLSAYEKGSIKLFGKSMEHHPYEIKRNLGIVMQDLGVYEEFTVYENIDYFCSLYVRDKQKRKELVERAIEMVALQDYVDCYPKKMSGGLQRRLNIACGIAHRPKLIIMDEPTVAIDVNLRTNIMEGIKELSQEGSTILYTSHYLEEIEGLCSQIAILDKGRIVARGSRQALIGMISIGETIKLEVSQLERAQLEQIRALSNVESVQYEGELLEIQYKKGRNNLLELLELLKQEGVQIGNIYDQAPNLNDVFRELTGGTL